jgi:hypothetical protein
LIFWAYVQYSPLSLPLIRFYLKYIIKNWEF